MNKYKKALNTIGDTLTYYMVRKDLASLPSDNEIFDSMETLMELVDKEIVLDNNGYEAYIITCALLKAINKQCEEKVYGRDRLGRR